MRTGAAYATITDLLPWCALWRAPGALTLLRDGARSAPDARRRCVRLRLRHQLAQHERQDAAVFVVIHFDGRRSNGVEVKWGQKPMLFA